MKIKRIWRHFTTHRAHVRKLFPNAVLSEITAKIKESETKHSGELRVIIEASLTPVEIISGKTPRERAQELFAQERVWDTEHNSGVLVYVLVADRAFELLADRGVLKAIGQGALNRVAKQVEEFFHRGEMPEGLFLAIHELGTLLTEHFPARGKNPNELSDAPKVVG